MVADTDREAMELGRRAWPHFYASFMKLWKKYGTQPRYARLPEDFDTVVKNGGALVGSPGTLRDQIRGMTTEAGVSYFIAQFSFGDLTYPAGSAELSRHLCARGHSCHAGACRPGELTASAPTKVWSQLVAAGGCGLLADRLKRFFTHSRMRWNVDVEHRDQEDADRARARACRRTPAVPTSRRLISRGAGAMTSGSRPRMKAIEVIITARKRMRAPSTAASHDRHARLRAAPWRTRRSGCRSWRRARSAPRGRSGA